MQESGRKEHLSKLNKEKRKNIHKEVQANETLVVRKCRRNGEMYSNGY